MATVVVLGGYGVFGSRIVRSLIQHDGLDIVVAGRRAQAAQDFCARLPLGRARPVALDCRAADGIEKLQWLHPTAVVDAAGPFHERDFSLARACAARRIHYIDLADNRERVCGIIALQSLCAANGVLTVSGASTVPALSTAVLDELASGFSAVTSVDVGISPGHRAPRGVATVQSILSYCGRPIPAFVGGTQTTEMGWGDLRRHRYPAPVGPRWLSNVDVPERTIWPARFPHLKTVRFSAGLEVATLHLALSAASSLVRAGIVRSLVPYASLMIRVADAADVMASDSGAMHVAVTGTEARARSVRRTWTLIAERGDGPQIPATPAALLVKKLIGLPGYVPMTERGARPCTGLLSLAEILAELRPFAIRTQLEEEAVTILG